MAHGLTSEDVDELFEASNRQTRRRMSTLGYAQKFATLRMDECQRVARRSLSRCLRCPANAGVCVFRG